MRDLSRTFDILRRSQRSESGSDSQKGKERTLPVIAKCTKAAVFATTSGEVSGIEVAFGRIDIVSLEEDEWTKSWRFVRLQPRCQETVHRGFSDWETLRVRTTSYTSRCT
jgi:hypothetical protein